MPCSPQERWWSFTLLSFTVMWREWERKKQYCAFKNQCNLTWDYKNYFGKIRTALSLPCLLNNSYWKTVLTRMTSSAFPGKHEGFFFFIKKHVSKTWRISVCGSGIIAVTSSAALRQSPWAPVTCQVHHPRTTTAGPWGTRSSGSWGCLCHEAKRKECCARVGRRLQVP